MARAYIGVNEQKHYSVIKREKRLGHAVMNMFPMFGFLRILSLNLSRSLTHPFARIIKDHGIEWSLRKYVGFARKVPSAPDILSERQRLKSIRGSAAENFNEK